MHFTLELLVLRVLSVVVLQTFKIVVWNRGLLFRPFFVILYKGAEYGRTWFYFFLHKRFSIAGVEENVFDCL